MLKNILPAIFFIVLFFKGYSQSADVNGRVNYRFIDNLDTTQYHKDSIGLNSFLYFSNNNSLFVYDRLKDKKADNLIDTIIDNFNVIKYPERYDEMGQMYYSDFLKKRLIVREFVGNKVFIAEESTPVINWTIDTITKLIGNIVCQKATGNFRGRTYVAWFTNKIPKSIGPWKLNGLPGLILEAYDTRREVQWLFSSINIPFDITKDLITPSKGEKISFEQYKTIRRTEGERAIQLVKSSLPRGSEVEMSFTYYPIEKTYE